MNQSPNSVEYVKILSLLIRMKRGSVLYKYITSMEHTKKNLVSFSDHNSLQ